MSKPLFHSFYNDSTNSSVKHALFYYGEIAVPVDSFIFGSDTKVEDIGFDQFDDAERYVKRSYHAWLRSDKDVVEDFVRVLPLTKEQIMDRYHLMIKAMLYQEEDVLS